MSSSVGAQDVNIEKLRIDAMKGKWSEVFETCMKNRALYTAKITGTGDTVLHMAVSNGQEMFVSNMVDFLFPEENNRSMNVAIPIEGGDDESLSVDNVLGAENDRKNTPLHLAAVNGNVKICKKIGGKKASLITGRNVAGETPLFLAAIYGRKEAFLWLHYLYMEGPGVSSTDFAHCTRDNNDTILHCSIAEGHIDLAIEIIHLYKDRMNEMIKRNKEGLSPLHLLAAKPSTFKNTTLLELPIRFHPIYRCLKVKEKNQATTHEELQKGCLKVEQKNRATTHEELQNDNQETNLVKVIKFVYLLLPVFLLLVLFVTSLLGVGDWALLGLAVLLLLLIRLEYRQASLIKFTKFVHLLVPFILLLLLFVIYVAGVGVWALLDFAVLLLLLIRPGLRQWLHEMRKEKEKHTWSPKVMNELLHHCSDDDMSQIISRTCSEQLSISLQGEEFNELDNLGTTVMVDGALVKFLSPDDKILKSESMATPSSGRITIETPLMIAVKTGVVEMVERILELFPSRINDVNAEGKNILLLAVEYRRKEVVLFLSKQKWLSESLFRQVDKDGNNALHLAARLELKLGEAPSMSTEIMWYEFVKNSVPHDLLGRYNKKMEIPSDIFRESHEELLKSEVKWATKTSQACSVVTTLVASASFATRTNVPGGFDDDGYPILTNNPVFRIFKFSSFGALLFSLISTICFLSIAASRSQSIHSWRFVPSKLYFGMSFMFLSIFCLWVSFCAADYFMPSEDQLSLLEEDLLYYIALSSVIIFLVVMQLPTFFGPALSGAGLIHVRRHKATVPIEYRRIKSSDHSTDLNLQN